MRVTGDLSFLGSFLAAFSLEAWVFSRVLRLLRPKLTLMKVIVFMPFKVDTRYIHVKNLANTTSSKCVYIVKSVSTLLWLNVFGGWMRHCHP
jgi:hypothetical protein